MVRLSLGFILAQVMIFLFVISLLAESALQSLIISERFLQNAEGVPVGLQREIKSKSDRLCDL